MALDQVHEQNNHVIKSTGGATDLVNKCDDSALIRWETCGPDIARIIKEFEESGGATCKKNLSTKHHEDNNTFCLKFTADIKTLVAGLPINPFKSTKLHRINNSEINVPFSKFEIVKSIEGIGKSQFTSFLKDRLIWTKKHISETIHNNNFKVWDLSEEETAKPFRPTNTTINKMRSACEHRSDLAETVFKYEILDVPQSLAKTSLTQYKGKKSDITNRFSSSFQNMPNDESDSAIIIEMSPVIRAKCSSICSDVNCFGDLAVVILYYIQSLSNNYRRVDMVFDRYFDTSLKEDTRKGRGIGSRFVLTEDTP